MAADDGTCALSGALFAGLPPGFQVPAAGGIDHTQLCQCLVDLCALLFQFRDGRVGAR
jgi:hypothetical protein